MRGLLLELIIVAVALCLLWHKKSIPVVEFEKTLDLLPNPIREEVVYEYLENNLATCDLTTFTLLCESLQKDGYEVVSKVKDDDYIEIILSNGEMIHHMRWCKDNSLANISNPYEKSYIPFSYISEK